MKISQAQYANAKGIAEEIQKQPPEVRQAILNMLHGAVAISDLYLGTAHKPPLQDTGQDAARPSA